VPGTEAKVGKYTIRFERLAHEEDRQKEMVTGEVTALVDGKVFDHLRPAKWFFHNHESEPTTEVAIRRSPAEDLYVTLGGYDLAEGSATLKVVVNPVVDWIWFGFMLLAIGTAIALIPDSVLDRLTVRVREREGAGASGSSVAGLIIWLAVGATAAGLVPGLGERAAHAQAPTAAAAATAPQMAITDLKPPSPSGADENWLVRNIICQCGSCRHNLLECESDGCAYGARERVEVHNLLAQGKTRDEVIQYYITKFGSQIALASPIDKGFNRLAWLLPYGLAGVAAGLLGYGAYRLSRRPAPLAPAGTPMAMNDPDLQDKLEDELRNLD
jgi:cytochrome c-type biogenesis protein CcmF